MKEITFLIIMWSCVVLSPLYLLWKLESDRQENGDKYCKDKYGINAVYKYPECYLKTN